MMTKDEIKKRVLSDECYLDAIAELVADIAADEKDYIESRPKFLPNEIVRYVHFSGLVTYQPYKYLSDTDKLKAEKLSIEEFAETTRPPDAETWELYDHYIRYRDSDALYCTNPWGHVIQTYCPHGGEAEGDL